MSYRTDVRIAQVVVVYSNSCMLYPDSTLSLLAQSFSHNENTSETGSLMYCISILQLKATCRVHVWKMAYSIYVSLFFSFFLSLSLIKITVITVHFCCTNYLPIWLCFVSTCLKLLLYLLLQICDILTKYTNLLENIKKIGIFVHVSPIIKTCYSQLL